MSRRQPPRILIHIGHTKCGSTTFQKFLAAHRVQLGKAGFLLPEASKVNVEDQGLSAYAGLDRCLNNYIREHKLSSEDVANFDKYFEKKLIKEIENSDAHTVVFSHEGLFPRSSESIKKLMGLLNNISHDIHAFVVLRRQDRWAVSSYNTRLSAHGTSTRDVFKNNSGQPHGLMYANKLSLWVGALGAGALTVVAFEDHQDILDPFTEFLGFKPSPFHTQHDNKGMSAYSQEVMRVFNEMRERQGIPAIKQRQTRKLLREILPTGPAFRPSAQQAEALLAYFYEDSERLKGRFLSPDSKFFSDAEPFPEEARMEVVSEEEVLSWLEKLPLGY
ncbi:hypothetical protein [Amphritea japonica]|uniref:Sulfotransferase domain-containing protein n=1 Tax=Amphritea japonica ATCC BAA-1530 TaxID=1278309 RepID=A0A7R6SU21_9GAMM|nr:hypothetical protein [Amphritea japonica]BBB27300.1 hypothetical protein AMJAP_2714 [Amphritea japonica ATCC BAA-1530]